MKSQTDRGLTAGIVLVVIGLLLLGANWFQLTGAVALGAISAVFLVMYANTRQYGFLVPGMILGGLAAGVAVQDAGYDSQGGFVVVGLACGFIGIYIVDLIVRGPALWWPLVPGGILGIVGITQVTEGTAAEAEIARYWPLALVAAGIVLLVANAMRGRTTPEATSTPSQKQPA